MESTLERDFAQAIAGGDREVDLFGAAIIIARLGRPQVDSNALARQLDLIAEAVLENAGAGGDAEALGSSITQELFETRGFHGNSESYEAPENSYIDQVIQHRTGIPITLSLVYMEVAQRVGLECEGIGFPGHFLVRCGGEDGFYVDPFSGGTRPTREELISRLATHGELGPSPEALLAAVTRRQILQRMLNNLCAAYRGLSDASRWIAAIGLRLQLEPWNAALYLERGMLRYRQKEHELAFLDLERYVGGAGPDANQQAARIVDELRERLGRQGESE